MHLKPCRSHALRLLAKDEDRSFEDGVRCGYASLRRWTGGAQRTRERLGAGDSLEAQPHVREEARTLLRERQQKAGLLGRHAVALMSVPDTLAERPQHPSAAAVCWAVLPRRLSGGSFGTSPSSSLRYFTKAYLEWAKV